MSLPVKKTPKHSSLPFGINRGRTQRETVSHLSALRWMSQVLLPGDQNIYSRIELAFVSAAAAQNVCILCICVSKWNENGFIFFLMAVSQFKNAQKNTCKNFRYWPGISASIYTDQFGKAQCVFVCACVYLCVLYEQWLSRCLFLHSY